MKKEGPANEKKKRDSYAATEVGALLEEIRDSVSRVAEGHGSLDQRLERLETEVSNNTQGLVKVEMGVSLLTGRVGRVEDGLLKLSKDLRDTREEIGAKIDRVDQRLTAVESHR